MGITKDDLMTIAKDNNIKKGEKIIKGINAVVSDWKLYADKAKVRTELKNRIHKYLNTI